MIETTCPKCQNIKRFTDDKIGKKYKCPVCSEIVIINKNNNDGLDESLQTIQSSNTTSLPIKEYKENLNSENEIDKEKIIIVPQENSKKNWVLICFIGISAIALIWLIIWKVKSPHVSVNNSDSTKLQTVTSIDSVSASPKSQSNKLIVDTFLLYADNSQDGISTYTISSEKAYLYSAANKATIQKTYLGKGQQIPIISESNGFVMTILINDQGIKTFGWVNKDDVIKSSFESQENQAVDSILKSSLVVIDPRSVIKNENNGYVEVYKYVIVKDIVTVRNKLKSMGAEFENDNFAYLKVINSNDRCYSIKIKTLDNSKTLITYGWECD